MIQSKKMFGIALVFSLGICSAWSGWSAFAAQPADSPSAKDRLQFNRDIRPILADNCFACHGADSASRKAGLRLDRRDDAIKADAIVPNKPDDSGMVERIFAEDAGQRMPPPKTKKTLTAAQKETLKRWIAEGAEYQPHWSFIAPVRPALPVVKDAAWAKNPVDRFILAELEKRGLKPAPEADRRTLARRVSLDLTGLPPEPAVVEAFVNDKSPDAYERYVDETLKSPHWGEHRGRYWLDAARYADTHGIHFDNYREIWAYRDWVIKAFNNNMPFDQFTIEQLAGDLLPNRSLDQQIASGFNRCNITTNEGGVIAEEYAVYYTRDRTETTSQVWMGLTTGCAVCHDHKFDPITQRDFYSMSAFFNNTTQPVMDGNVKNTPPVITVPRAEDRSRWASLSKDLADVSKQAESRKQAAKPNFDKWLAAAKPGHLDATLPTDNLKFHALLNEGGPNAITALVDGRLRSVSGNKPLTWQSGHTAQQAYFTKLDTTCVLDDVGDFDTKQPFSFGAWINLNKRAQFGTIAARMDNPGAHRGWDFWVENSRVGTHIISKWQDDALKVVANTPLRLNQWNHVFITYDGSAKASGVQIYVNGVPQETTVEVDKLKGSIRTAVPFKIGQRNVGQSVDGVLLQDLRIYGRVLTALEVDKLGKGARAAWLATKPADKRSQAETEELFSWWLAANDPPYQALTDKRIKLQQEENTVKARGTIAHVMQEKPSEPTAYILYRGEYDKRRDPVKPATPASLPPMPQVLPKNRIGLAEWLLRPEHPLTARVTVNRFWQELFGTGIVRTTGDLGTSGDLPTHPELLDWLAVEFRENGWNMKKFFKMLVMSNAYRQAATTTPEKLEKDPQNRYLSRGPRFRMDGEMIRDYALAASGLLVRKLGGPSVKPYQPEGVWEAVAMIGSDTRDYKRDTGDALYRRSMYTFWKRAAPPASMDLFNAPTRETCTVRRERTDTPLQALVTLNDVQFVEAARHLAELALKDGGKNRIDCIARRLLARPMTPEETKVVQTTLDDLVDYYKTHPTAAAKLIAVGESKADPKVDVPTLAGWTMAVNEMMNLDEVLNK